MSGSRILTIAVLVLGGCLAASSLTWAACYPLDQQLPAKAVSDFLANPEQVLQSADLPSAVRDLVASNPAALAPAIALLAKATPGQQSDIGNGLAQAANLCLKGDASFAADIQSQLAASNSDGAKTKFAAITGNFPIEATGGVGGGSGGGSGGQTNPLGGNSSSAGNFQTFGPNAFSNPATNYFTSSITGASSITGTNTTSATSVSP